MTKPPVLWAGAVPAADLPPWRERFAAVAPGWTFVVLALLTLATAFGPRVPELLGGEMADDHVRGLVKGTLSAIAGACAGWAALAAAHASWRPALANTSARQMGLLLLGVLPAATLLGLSVAMTVLWWRWPSAERFVYLGLHGVFLLWPLGVLGYLARVTHAQWCASRRQVDEAQVEARSMCTELAESELLALQAQVEPHFLFNTLAHVKWQYAQDAAGGRLMLERLLAYVRQLLPKARAGTIKLAEEVNLVRSYLEIVGLRMGARLRWRIEVPDALAAAPIPSLALLTLVENAVKHGIGKVSGGGAIEIDARQQGALAVIHVRDDGAGLMPGAGSNIGLANLQAKLALLPGGGALSLRSRTPRGAVAMLALPLAANHPPALPLSTAGGAQASALPWGWLGVALLALAAYLVVDRGITFVFADAGVFDWRHAGLRLAAPIFQCLVTVPILLLTCAWMRPAPRAFWPLLVVSVAIGAVLGALVWPMWVAAVTGFDETEAPALRGATKQIADTVFAFISGMAVAVAIELMRRRHGLEAALLGLRDRASALRRRRANARLAAQRARLDPDFLAIQLQRVHVAYEEDAVRGEATLDRLIAHLRAVAANVNPHAEPAP